MTDKHINRAIEDLLFPKPQTAWQKIRTFVPAALAFLFYVSLFIAFAWFMAKIEREHEARIKDCDTKCLARGYHGGDLADDLCVCESREVLLEQEQ